MGSLIYRGLGMYSWARASTLGVWNLPWSRIYRGLGMHSWDRAGGPEFTGVPNLPRSGHVLQLVKDHI